MRSLNASALTLALLVLTIDGGAASAQPAAAHDTPVAAPPASHIVVPFLASATKPAALEFEGAECDTDASGSAMTCTFQQVFLTLSAVAPDTCLITTNRYDRSFQREAAGKWVSTGAPEGECGVVDVATLSDGGGVRWTLELRKTATKKDAAECRAVDEARVVLSWENILRPLPCRFVQPAGLSR